MTECNLEFKGSVWNLNKKGTFGEKKKGTFGDVLPTNTLK